MRHYYEEVTIKATYYWNENGKRRQRTGTFMQTLNPFNRDSDGIPKDRSQIMAELTVERDAWLESMGSE